MWSYVLVFHSDYLSGFQQLLHTDRTSRLLSTRESVSIERRSRTLSGHLGKRSTDLGMEVDCEFRP